MHVIPLVDEGLGSSAYVVDLGDGGALVLDHRSLRDGDQVETGAGA